MQQMGAAIVEKIPVGRFGTMEELAKVITFFASDGSTFILDQS